MLSLIQVPLLAPIFAFGPLHAANPTTSTNGFHALKEPTASFRVAMGTKPSAIDREKPNKPGPPDAAHKSSAPSEIGRSTETRKAELRKAVAKSLRDEAYALQQKGLLKEAVARYRESLTYWPDDGLEKYLVHLERRVGAASIQARPVAVTSGAGDLPGQPQGGAQGITIPATVRNRSSRDIYLYPDGETADQNHLVRPGEVRTVMVSIGPTGRVTFRASRDGGVIGSATWYGDSRAPERVPCLLFDDSLSGQKLIAMTGIKRKAD